MFYNLWMSKMQLEREISVSDTTFVLPLHTLRFPPSDELRSLLCQTCANLH